MEAVISNFDEYLKAFGLTIGLFVVSGIASLVLGTILAVIRVGPVSILNKAAALYVTLVPQHAAADDLRLHLHRHAGARLQLQVRRGRRDRRLQRLRLLLPRLPGAHPLHLGLRLRGDALRRQRRPARTGRGRPRHRADLRPVDDPGRPPPGRARRDPADDQRARSPSLKNTSVAAAFGLAEATATMRGFTNNNADQRIGIFLAFAIGYIILVEVDLAVVLPRRAKGEGGPMSASVLFDAPGPRTVARHRIYTRRQPRRAGGGWSPSSSGRCTTRVSSSTRCGSRSSPPSTSSTSSSTASSRPSRWPFFVDHLRGRLRPRLRRRQAVATAVGAVARLAGRGVLPRRAGAAADGLLLLPAGHRQRSAELVLVRGHRPDALQRRRSWRRSSAPASTPCRAARPRRRTPSACASRR